MGALMEAQLGRLGARWSLNFRPRDRAVFASPLGRFYDHPFRLRVAVVSHASDGDGGSDLLFPHDGSHRGGQAVGLPFDRTVDAAPQLRQAQRPASIIFDAPGVIPGWDLHVELVAPFVPRNIRASCVPAMLLDVALRRQPGAAVNPDLSLEVALLPDFEARTRANGSAVFTETYFGASADHPAPRDERYAFSALGTVGIRSLRDHAADDDGVFRFPVPVDTTEVLTAFALIGHTAESVSIGAAEPCPLSYVRDFPSVDVVESYVQREEMSLRAGTALFESCVTESSLDPAAQALVAHGWQGYLTNTWWLASADAAQASDMFTVWDGSRLETDDLGVLYASGIALMLLWPEFLHRQIGAAAESVSRDTTGRRHLVQLLYSYWQWTDDWEAIAPHIKLVREVVGSMRDAQGNPTAVAATLEAALSIAEEAADDDLTVLCEEVREALDLDDANLPWSPLDLLYPALIDEALDVRPPKPIETGVQDDRSLSVQEELAEIVAAGYAGIDALANVGHLWSDFSARNATGGGGLWSEPDDGECVGTRYGARGVLAFALVAAAGGLSVNRAAERLGLAPPRVPARVPIVPMADWQTLRMPWAELRFENGMLQPEFTHEDLLGEVGDLNTALPMRSRDS